MDKIIVVIDPTDKTREQLVQEFLRQVDGWVPPGSQTKAAQLVVELIGFPLGERIADLFQRKSLAELNEWLHGCDLKLALAKLDELSARLETTEAKLIVDKLRIGLTIPGAARAGHLFFGLG